MRTQTTAAQAAKLIRQEIKAKFPGLKTQVTSENYSGGNSIRIKMQNQTKEIREAIEKLVAKYEYGTFDGMTDCYNMTNVRKDLPQVKFIFVNNELSPELRATLKTLIANEYGLEDINSDEEWKAKTGEYNDITVWRAFNNPEYNLIIRAAA